MKPLNLILLVLFSISLKISFSQGFGQSVLLKEWYFINEDVKSGSKASIDHSKWQRVVIPHDWSVKRFASPHLSSCTGYLPGGIGWYRTEFEVNEPQKDKRFYIYFEGVYNNSEVYINGELLGKRPNGYVSFMYDLTSYINHETTNVIAVRVDHSKDADSRWYTGSGIYRDVHLVTANQLHIDEWGVFYTTELQTKDMALINIETSLVNHAKKNKVTVIQKLTDVDGKTVNTSEKILEIIENEKATVNHQLNVANPQLWDIDNPYLYKLVTTIVHKRKIIDEKITNVGIRKLTFDHDKGFALNDKWIKIKGVCLHHDAGVLGAAVPKVVWKERLLQLKKIGVNGIRMSHNPQATDLYDLCDELGFLVKDEAFDEWEFPKKKWITGWNKGTPGFQGSAEYFNEWSKEDLKSVVLKNRNHPSVIMWSIGNEVDYPNDPYSHPSLDSIKINQKWIPGYKKDQPHASRLGNIAKELAAVVRTYDESRPVTAALAGAAMSNHTEYPGVLDAVGYNYTEHRYQADHDQYPNRILYGSETKHHYKNWKAVTDNEFIFGQFIWTGADYLGEAGRYPSRGARSGMVDLANHIKPRGYFRKALWTGTSTAYMGTYLIPKSKNRISIDAPKNWNYEVGDSVRVVCYTNCEEAELWLNGKVAGKRKPYNNEVAIIYWDIVFEPGKLEVICYNKGQKKVTDYIITNTRPQKMVAKSNTSILKGKYDVAIITLNIIDDQGNHVYQGDNEITCIVKGDGELLGLENASNNVAENYLDNKHRCKNGRLVAYIHSTKEQGKIEVEFTSPFLEKANVKLIIKSN